MPSTIRPRRACYYVASVSGLLNTRTTIIRCSSVGSAPLLVTVSVSFNQPNIMSTSTVRACGSCYYVSSVGGLLNTITPVTACSCSSVDFVPQNVAICVCLNQPNIHIRLAETRGCEACYYVSSVGCLRNTPAPVPVCSSVGLVPQSIAVFVCLNQPNITSTSTVRPRVARDYVSSVGCLRNTRTIIIIYSSVGFAPQNFAVFVSLDQQNVSTPSTIRLCPAYDYVASVSGLCNTATLVIVCSSVGFVPQKRPTVLLCKRVVVIVGSWPRYVGVSYAVSGDGMFACSASVVNAWVVRPVVSLQQVGMMPVVVCRVDVVCLIYVVNNVVVINNIV